MEILTRIQRWARLKHHALALAQARRQLELAVGADFDRMRDRVFELAYCPDPMECACLEAKPWRKVREA